MQLPGPLIAASEQTSKPIADSSIASLFALILFGAASVFGVIFYKRLHKILSKDIRLVTNKIEIWNQNEPAEDVHLRSDEASELNLALERFHSEQSQIQFSLKEQTRQAEIRVKALDKYVNQLVSSNAETVGSLNDLEWKNAKLEELNNRLEQLAFTDGLTGLCNHRTFQEKLRTSFSTAKRYDQPLALMILDVDHFKKLNDNMGHPAGDAVLVDLAKILQTMVRESDIAARYGGEEFAVILPMTDLDGAIQMGDRIRESFEKSQSGPAPYTVSIGVAVITPLTEKPNDLLQIADSSLYHAKKSGRNRVSAVQKNQFERRGA